MVGGGLKHIRTCMKIENARPDTPVRTSGARTPARSPTPVGAPPCTRWNRLHTYLEVVANGVPRPPRSRLNSALP